MKCVLNFALCALCEIAMIVFVVFAFMDAPQWARYLIIAFWIYMVRNAYIAGAVAARSLRKSENADGL
jgi:hypothetical protein